MKGYKVFNPIWMCRGFQYQVGESYEMDVMPIICDRGFHFCKELEDCFRHYAFNPQNKVAEVEAYGDVISEDRKSCTNKIKIVREIPWGEVLRIVNAGHHNTGRHNTGNHNTGNRNTGDFNTGGCNAGRHNTGYHNTGNYNAGEYNTGDHNRGDYNTGDYNCISGSSGCFNTSEEKIIMFNKASDWTIKDWWASKARTILGGMPKETVWIELLKMTNEEKCDNPDCEILGGYLKILDGSGNVQAWWDKLPDSNKQVVLALPNFDADIFEECTGIRV